MRAALLRGEQVDHRELLAVTDGLQRLLPREREPEAVIDDGDDPHENLMRIIEDWIDADKANRADEEAERIAQGLPANELEAAQMRIAQLEDENALLRGEPKALPSPEAEKVITPSLGDIVPPGEQGVFYAGKRPGPDDHKVLKRKTVIDVKAEPANEPAPGLRRVPGIHGLQQALSGDETKARMARRNADRSEEYRVMTQSIGPNAPQPSSPNDWRGYSSSNENFFWNGKLGRER